MRDKFSDDIPDGKSDDDLFDYLASLSMKMTQRLSGLVVLALGASSPPEEYQPELHAKAALTLLTAVACFALSLADGDLIGQGGEIQRCAALRRAAPSA
eukprot:SAG22_NODE_2504_length_2504_cov_1.404990_2_plen_99_part_00